MMNCMSFFSQGETGTVSPSDGPAEHCGLPARLAADIHSFLVADDGSFKHDAIETMLAYLLKLKREVANGSRTHDNANAGKVPFNFNGMANANGRHPVAVGHHAATAHLVSVGESPTYANFPTHALRAMALAASMNGTVGSYGPPPAPPLAPLGLLPHDAGIHLHAHREALRQVAANNARGVVFAARLAACQAAMGKERGAEEVCGEKRKGEITTDPDVSANSKRMRFERAPGATPVGLLGNPPVAQDFPSSHTADWTYDQWANAAALPMERMSTLSADAAAEERANRLGPLMKKKSYAGGPCSGASINILANSSSTAGAANGSNRIVDLEQRWHVRHGVATVNAESIESKAQKRKYQKTPLQSRPEDVFDPAKNRPLNRFNLFCILESERLHMKTNDGGDPTKTSTKKTPDLPPGIATGYEGLKMPELPPRFKDLTPRELFVRTDFILSLSDAMLFAHFQLDFRQIEDDWFVPGRRKLVKRSHRKSHGAMGFKEMARELAVSWRAIDGETLKYCTDCARIIADRYTEIITNRDSEAGYHAGGRPPRSVSS